jgi:hypothetical protein
MKTTVINIKKNHFNRETDVYIGRGSKWGNPYFISHIQTRDEVCEKYIAHMTELMKADPTKYNIAELQGKRLACYCKPLRCHGDWLAALANGEVALNGRV